MRAEGAKPWQRNAGRLKHRDVDRKGAINMLQADIYELNQVEYIVIDCAVVTMDQKGLAKLADRRQGIGADRILLIDQQLGRLIAAADAEGVYELLSLEDYQIANYALGKAEKGAGVRHAELRITDCFLQQLIAPIKNMKIAG